MRKIKVVVVVVVPRILEHCRRCSKDVMLFLPTTSERSQRCPKCNENSNYDSHDLKRNSWNNFFLVKIEFNLHAGSVEISLYA